MDTFPQFLQKISSASAETIENIPQKLQKISNLGKMSMVTTALPLIKPLQYMYMKFIASVEQELYMRHNMLQTYKEKDR